MTEWACPPGQEDTERWVLEVCKGLGLEVGDAEADFFEAGGTSLAAMKLIAKAEERYGEDVLPPDDLFAESSVRQIAASIQRNHRLGAGANEG
jgi:acyl carrier protein